MRKIIGLLFGDPVPDLARPLGAAVEKRLIAGGPQDVTVFYYDIPVAEPKKKEEKKNGTAERGQVQEAGSGRFERGFR